MVIHTDHLPRGWACLALFIALAACGEPDPVSLVATTPDDGATEVALDTAIVVEFDRPLNSVSAQLSPEAPMTHKRAARHNDHWVVEYELEQPLEPSTTYELTVGAIDTAQRFQVSFRTIDEE